MRMLRTSAVLWLVLALTASLALAQSWAGKGRMFGEITDKATNQPIAGAKITLHSPKDPSQGPAPMTTDKKGKFSYLGLVGGTWTVTIEANGYNTAEGPAEVNEFGPSPAVRVGLNKITEEQIQAAVQEERKKNPALQALDHGNALLGEGKWAEARAEYEKALGTVDVKAQPMVLRSIAGTYLQEKNAQGAIDTLQKALALDPADADAQRMLAQAYFAGGQQDKAIETAKKYVDGAAQPDPQLVQFLANTLADAGRVDEARQYLAKLPGGGKIDPAALLNVGIRQYNENKMKDALASFDRVVQENPDMAEAYYYRGLANMASGKMKEAKADFQKLLQLAPNGEHAKDAKEFLKELK